VTIPNLLTLLRAAGIPLFLFLVAEERYSWAVLVLVIGGASDYLDGKLARALKQESRLGELLDPAVDRLYIASVLIAMYLTDAIPLWVLALIVMRDLILGILLLVMKRKNLNPFKVTYLGKAATFNLLYALPLLLLAGGAGGEFSDVAFIAGWAFAGWGIGLYLWTGVGYARTGISELKEIRSRAVGKENE
jgi:cardiolipin synthase